MPQEEWYRQTAWTPDVARAFEEKLARARGARSEYLRIQSATLAETLDTENSRAAIELASRYLRENPEGIFRGTVYQTVALAWTTLRDVDRAVEAYRKALAVERDRPNVRTYGYIKFAWFVAVHELSEVYDEAFSAMETDLRDQDLGFPSNRYRYFGALALISSALGDAQYAKRMARNALAAAAQQAGPFAAQPELGTVPALRDAIHAKIADLAGDPADQRTEDDLAREEGI